MIKRGIILLILLTFLYPADNIANAQSYSIESIEGIITKVSLSHELASGILAISYLKDTLFINEYLGNKEVNVLNKKILQIIYDVRSGSDEDVRHLLLLCVNGGKLYQALHVTSFSTYDVEKVWDKKADSLKLFDEHELYQLKLNLTGDNKMDFMLNINIHDEVESKHDPKTNHNYNKKVALNFDTSKNIFYSDYETISEYFRVYDPKVEKPIKQYIMGNFPVIKLDTTYYYCIKGEWYERGSEDYLFKYSYKNINVK